MKKKLTASEYITVASMLFGLFFGAGNLIFPVYMGQMAGRNMWLAAAGFLVTGVGLPLLGVAALGISRCDGLASLSARVGRGYGLFFTCALYLTIGPFFAIPRCATVPFTVGLAPLLEGGARAPALAAFSGVFFAAVLFFSLRPGKILTWVGKVLNPIFLISLGILLAVALTSPLGQTGSIQPLGAYSENAFFTGFLEGYNTMDALASLAFGIIVVDVIRKLGVTEPAAVAASTVKAGFFSCLMMAVLYIAVTLMGAQSRGLFEASANGGDALALIAGHYFGDAGSVVLTLIVTFACLKTAVGLITSCSENFAALFPGGPAYRAWAVGFCLLSFLIANLGLDAIIAYAVPALMFLYPLAITLIALSLCGHLFGNDRTVYLWVTGCTLPAALLDLLRTLPAGLLAALRLEGFVAAAQDILPFARLGMGWLLPALAGLAIGLALRGAKNKRG